MICRNVGQINRHFPAGILTAASYFLLPKCPVCAGALLAAAGVALPVDGVVLRVAAFFLLAARALLFVAAFRDGMFTFPSIVGVLVASLLLSGARPPSVVLWPAVAGTVLVAAAVAWRRRGKCSRGCASEFH